MNIARTRHAARLSALVAIGLVPWTGWLAITLPATTTASHWSTAWVGLDVLIATGAAISAVMLAQWHPRADLALVATAAAMLIDAWFDTVTSAGSEVTAALLEAGLVEVPLAIAGVVVAVRLGSRRKPTSALAAPDAELGTAPRPLTLAGAR